MGKIKIKLKSRNRTQEGGHVLAMVLVVVAIGAFALLSYLQMVNAQNRAVARSQGWNAAVPVMEAGIEEALAHLNANGGAALNVHGWTQVGNYYRMERYLAESYYVVIISVTNPSLPVIESRGFCKMPTLVQHNTAAFFLAAAGYSSPRQGYVGRGVRIQAKKNGALVKGILTKDKITMSGNVTIDSYASCDPAKSTNGRYDPAKAQDNGGVACNGIISGDEITVSGNIKIKGPLSTGPGGTAGVSGSISVGSKTWVDAGTTGIQPGWFRNDMNANIADAPAAPTGGFTSFPGGGTVNGVTYDWILNSGTYTINNSFSMSGQKKMLINGDVKIHFKGDLSMSGQSAINMAPTANLQIWGSGATISLSGQGLMNNTGDPSRFTYYGLASNTKVNLSGTSDFIGIIYAPYAEVTPSGGSKIHGAIVAKKFTGSGGFTLHYDECLGGSGSQARYIVTAWNEMTPQEVAQVP